MFVRVFTCLIMMACLAPRAVAQLPAGFEETPFISGPFSPMAMTYAPDGRLFFLERAGGIRIYKNGALLPTKFAQLNVSTNNERGLSGIALHPNFATNGYVYIHYTTNSNSLNPPPTPKNRISRLTANGDVAVANSEVIIFDNIPSDSGYHNGGSIHFGLDGKLYAAIGDSGTRSNGQNLGTVSGKLLRLNDDGTAPSDNPFFG